MAQRCTVCHDPRQPEVDRALGLGTSDHKVARRFSLTRDAVRRHRLNHLLKPAEAMVHRMGAGHLRRSLEVIATGQGPPTPAELVAAAPLLPTRELVLKRVLAIAEDLQARRAKVDGDALAARLSDSERAAWADIAKLLGFGTPGPAVAVQVNNHQAAAAGSSRPPPTSPPCWSRSRL